MKYEEDLQIIYYVLNKGVFVEFLGRQQLPAGSL
jgi:hypothetical protein